MPRKKSSAKFRHALNRLVESALDDILKKRRQEAEGMLSGLAASVRRIEKYLSKTAPKRAAGRRRKKGKARPAGKVVSRSKKVCRVRGCKEPRKAKGLCNKHYVAAFRKRKLKLKHTAKLKPNLKEKRI